MKMKNILGIGLVLALVILASSTAMAQPGNPNTPAPFGFLEALMAGGAAMGVRHYRKNRKKA